MSRSPARCSTSWWKVPLRTRTTRQIGEHGGSGRGREAGAGRVVLEVLRAKDVVGAVVVVTRWFGGVKLGGDRFRHFANAAAMAIEAARERRNL